MTSHAFPQATDARIIDDAPLQGYHRLWHVVESGNELSDMGRFLKVEEPREHVPPRFDRRSFPSEEELLMRLPSLGVPRVPPVRRIDPRGPAFFGFIEGDPLNEVAPAGTAVAPDIVDQFMAVFGSLAGVRPDTVAGCGIDSELDQFPTSSAQFLQGLIDFTRVEVYGKWQEEFGDLFHRLGVSAEELAPGSQFSAEAAKLTDRPFRLLHGDLHRANFIVDYQGKIWTIDWELATVGDPLCDLATHLHLMRYPEDQERDVIDRWKATVGDVLPEATKEVDADLPLYMAYKRLHSVYTDIVRQVMKVRECETPREREQQIRQSAKTVERVLVRAGDALPLRSVPSTGSIEAAYADLFRGD